MLKGRYSRAKLMLLAPRLQYCIFVYSLSQLHQSLQMICFLAVRVWTTLQSSVTVGATEMAGSDCALLAFPIWRGVTAVFATNFIDPVSANFTQLKCITGESPQMGM